ncbi:MAG: hypothetical protein Q7U59_14740, partial [Lutibacter sp.]|nr:hypothetical protein [Lutibacter sp.]
GVLNVPEFKKIVYSNLYNNIDLVYYYTDAGLKYDFIVKPGGDPTDIHLKYNYNFAFALWETK